MKRSADRILTTHTGSLPRPKQLAELLMAKDRGDAYDAAALAEAVRAAVRDVVRRQADSGIDIVDDGEMSKPGGYSTYIADRLAYGPATALPATRRWKAAARHRCPCPGV